METQNILSVVIDSYQLLNIKDCWLVMLQSGILF